MTEKIFRSIFCLNNITNITKVILPHEK
jgi:hypothetical protein